MTTHLPCFKAYDVRGRIPDELNEDLAFRIARAYAAHLTPRRVVLARDIRLSSPAIHGALRQGLAAAGVDVLDIGLAGTEEMYFATWHLGADGGMMVTASHNPADYNGIKLVTSGARPLSADSGLAQIEARVLANDLGPAPGGGHSQTVDTRPAFLEHLLGYVDRSRLRPLRIVANPGHGCAGPVLAGLAPHLPFTFIQVCFEPDGTFPAGVPNPLLPENRAVTAQAVRQHGADLGLAWDGDFDRCFFFDEQGGFIEGYYLVGLLAQAILARQPGAAIVHDPRLVWNTQELVQAAGGRPILSRAGHSFIKETMRAADGAYGGEMSAHHYFREFAYCDSGMIPWLLVTAILSAGREPLSRLVADRMARFPASGEINSKVADPDHVLVALAERYGCQALARDDLDGLSLVFADWRFNVRKSNTEPVLRLNVESRGNPALMAAKTAELLAIIRS
ncbi:MAG: phosphomannomutase [Thermodesulfobacteriota bacterium]